MAPVSACCLLLFLSLLLLFSLWPPNCCALLFYDRQTLLDIRSSVLSSGKADAECFLNEPHGSPPSDIPECLLRWHVDFTRKKRRKKRGKRAGSSARQRAYLRAGCGFVPLDLARGSMCGARTVWRPSDFSCRCLRPILPACLSPVLQFEAPRDGFRARQEGVDHANLRTLRRASVAPSTISPPKMALLNARSVVNKTFLLNNFFPFTSWILCL